MDALANRLVSSLPAKEQRQLLKHCQTVPLTYGEVICEAGTTFTQLYFPLSGFIALSTTLHDHPPLALCLIGDEGMYGATLTLGLHSMPGRALVQGSGSALRIGRAELKQCMGKCPALTRTLQHYLYGLLAQLANSVACGHFHALEPRLARWLLMIHDRAAETPFYLTHERLSNMLGVRRSGVSIAAGALQMRQLIHYSRGQITILDRQGLELAACECYAAMNEEFNRLLPLP